MFLFKIQLEHWSVFRNTWNLWEFPLVELNTFPQSEWSVLPVDIDAGFGKHQEPEIVIQRVIVPSSNGVVEQQPSKMLY